MEVRVWSRRYLFSGSFANSTSTIVRQCVGSGRVSTQLSILNAVFPTNQMEWAYERMINRLNRTMEARDDNTLLFFDEGNENWITKLIRKMRVFNPIPSDRGTWDTGSRIRNLPTARIIEDPVFKDSAHSYFIQLCDFCSYSLLRRESPTERARRYGIDRAFSRLSPVLFRQANRRDTEGIIRP